MFRLSFSTIPTAIGTAIGATAIFFASACLAQGENSTARNREISSRGDLTMEERSLTELVRQSSPSVVYITSIGLRRDFFSFRAMEIPQGTGSGFIWDDQGHIVTNFHVIKGAEIIDVTLSDERTYRAEVIGADPETDLALLKIDAKKLIACEWGDSRALREGALLPLRVGLPPRPPWR